MLKFAILLVSHVYISNNIRVLIAMENIFLKQYLYKFYPFKIIMRNVHNIHNINISRSSNVQTVNDDSYCRHMYIFILHTYMT